MWVTFWPDVLVACIGAGLTVLIAYATYKLNLIRDEAQSLNSLIGELHRRRALASRPVVIPGARENPDFARATSSVLSIRDEVRRTRDRVRQIEPTEQPLSRMTRACNYFLEASDAEPDQYAVLLVKLQADLSGAVADLASSHRGVRHLEPGAGAF
ncbi:hypothetical protein GCM10009532_24700 [Microbacterium aurantiacum]